ncbi:hypothetical protein SAMN05444394_3061 [Algoriphagus halophilus]|uniref:Uncharacterized protein n=1 Tax=Algoriphagus halophilus TaxID=226505 RepID=A0A1N6G941_9BACT|nr:hypothetical protein SAMN05444394_3061 [Algoriphagus halophilus]
MMDNTFMNLVNNIFSSYFSDGSMEFLEELIELIIVRSKFI